MAPALLGKHFRIACDDCGIEFEIDGVDVPRSKMAVCPNCGYTKTSFKNNTLLPATKGVLTQSTHLDRWDVVAFNSRSEKKTKPFLLVKRIVGLPGENIEIREGNIFVNGKIADKPQSIADTMKHLCFDSGFRPQKTGSLPRFQPSNDESNWIFNDTFRFSAPEEPDRNIDWLRFRPIKGYRHSGPRDTTTDVEDSYSYNQNLARSLHTVNEIELAMETSLGSKARLDIRLDYKEFQHTFQLTRRRLIVAIGDEQRKQFPISDLRPQSRISIKTFDSRIVVKIGSQRIVDLPVDARNSHPVSISLGGSGGEIQIERIKLFRDIYYLPAAVNQPASFQRCTLENDQYFVLGDNSPNSIDSRKFGPISRSQIVGIVEPTETATR